MKLTGRLTGHFLGRVALLVGGLGLVFLLWGGGLLFVLFQANRVDVAPKDVLRQAARTTTITGSGVALSPQTVSAAKRGGYWLQVLDENGAEITSTARPTNIPRHYTPGALVLDRQSPGANGLGQKLIATWVQTVGGRELTFVLGLPGQQPQGPFAMLNGRTNSPSPRTLLALFAALLVGGALVTVGVAWLFGRGLSRPLTHMMGWLSALASREYSEPVGRDGRPASLARDGATRRRPYSTYREVFDSLDTLTAELRSTEAERARLEAAREEWIAGVSHDLRTPLTSIQGYADVLASDYEFDLAEVRQQAGVIATKAAHMDTLLDDLNLSFRLRADALPLKLERTDLVELARENAVGLANDPRAAGREVFFDEPPGTGEVLVEVDSAMLSRAVGNVLVNAAVHNPEGAAIHVGVERETAQAVIRVADDGVGMDEVTRDRLFERYYRGTSTGASAEGTGLGMAIARQIVEAHGGTIEVTSAVAQGTTVTMRLPLSAS